LLWSREGGAEPLGRILNACEYRIWMASLGWNSNNWEEWIWANILKLLLGGLHEKREVQRGVRRKLLSICYKIEKNHWKL